MLIKKLIKKKKHKSHALKVYALFYHKDFLFDLPNKFDTLL